MVFSYESVGTDCRRALVSAQLMPASERAREVVFAAKCGARR
jgi:hypothetical protein